MSGKLTAKGGLQHQPFSVPQGCAEPTFRDVQRFTDSKTDKRWRIAKNGLSYKLKLKDKDAIAIFGERNVERDYVLSREGKVDAYYVVTAKNVYIMYWVNSNRLEIHGTPMYKKVGVIKGGEDEESSDDSSEGDASEDGEGEEREEGEKEKEKEARPEKMDEDGEEEDSEEEEMKEMERERERERGPRRRSHSIEY